MNENSALFLEVVESAKADLEGIKQSIINKGEITDDLSLIKIYYRGPA